MPPVGFRVEVGAAFWFPLKGFGGSWPHLWAPVLLGQEQQPQGEVISGTPFPFPGHFRISLGTLGQLRPNSSFPV